MIVSEVMTTKLITVTPDDTLSHAANLLRQYQFHHLPVVTYTGPSDRIGYIHGSQGTSLEFQGLLTSQDIDLASASGSSSSSDVLHRTWLERFVAEVIHLSIIRVSLYTSIESAAQVLV